MEMKRNLCNDLVEEFPSMGSHTADIFFNGTHKVRANLQQNHHLQFPPKFTQSLGSI